MRRLCLLLVCFLCLPGARAQERTLGLLGSGDPEVRDEVSQRLGESADRELIEAGLRSPDAEVRLRCRRLASLNPFGVSPFLLRAEADAVRRLGTSAASPELLERVARWGEPCRPIVEELLGRDHALPLRKEALRTLGRLGGERGRALVEQALADPELGRYALWPLRAVHSALTPELESLMVPFRDHDEEWVRARYWIVRGELGDEAGYEHAIEVMVPVLEDEGRRPWALANIAWIQSLAEDFEAGLKTVDQLLAVRPDRHSYLRRKASLLRGLRRYDEAIPVLERAHAQKPDDGATLSQLASTLHLAGRSREAAAYCLEAAEKGYAMDWTLNNLAWILATTEDKTLFDPAFALECARQAIELRPHSPSVRGTLGEALLAAGLLDEARAELEAAIALFDARREPRGAASERCFLAVCRLAAGDRQAAVELLARARSDDPTNPYLQRVERALASPSSDEPSP